MATTFLMLQLKEKEHIWYILHTGLRFIYRRRVSVGRHPQTGPDHVECEPAVRCCHVYA